MQLVRQSVDGIWLQDVSGSGPYGMVWYEFDYANNSWLTASVKWSHQLTPLVSEKAV